MDTTKLDEPSATGLRRLGPYEILSELGRGGMARVFRARQAGLERQVALKVILRGADASGEEFRRFQREMRVAASLSHPNLVHLLDCGIVDGTSYIAMELVEGGALSGILGNPVPWTVSLAALSRICDGLSVLHERTILHRDIKPANILLSRAGEIKLADFGLAAPMEGTRLTATGALVGTPLFVPPEVLTGGAFSPAGDLWAVGMVLYELLTGRSPFLVNSIPAAYIAVTSGRILSPSHWVPDLPALVSQLQMDLLNRDLAVRPRSAALIRDRADELLTRLGHTTWERQLGPGFLARCRAAPPGPERGPTVVAKEPPAKEVLQRQAPAQVPAPALAAPSGRRWPTALLMGTLLLAGLVAFGRSQRDRGPALQSAMPHLKAKAVTQEEILAALEAQAQIGPGNGSEADLLLRAFFNAANSHYFLQGATLIAELTKWPRERSVEDAQRLARMADLLTVDDKQLTRVIPLIKRVRPDDEQSGNWLLEAISNRIQIATLIQIKEASKATTKQLEDRISEFLDALRQYLANPHPQTIGSVQLLVYSLGSKLRACSRPKVPEDVFRVTSRLRAASPVVIDGVPEGEFLAELFAWGSAKSQFLGFFPDGRAAFQPTKFAEDFPYKPKSLQLLSKGLIAFASPTGHYPMLTYLVKDIHQAMRRRLDTFSNMGMSYVGVFAQGGSSGLLRVKTVLQSVTRAATALRGLLIRSRRDLTRGPELQAPAAIFPAYQLVALLSDLQVDFYRDIAGDRLKVREELLSPALSEMPQLFREFASNTETFLRLPREERNERILREFLTELSWCSHSLFLKSAVGSMGSLSKLGKRFREQLEQCLAERPDAPRILGWLHASVSSHASQFEPSQQEQQTFLRYFPQVAKDPIEAHLTKRTLAEILHGHERVLSPEFRQLLVE